MRLVTAIACVVLLSTLGRAHLFLWDESMYCAASAEMHAGASWLFATAGGVFDPVYGKPPLVNWLELLSTGVFGWSVYSLRLPTALGMIALIVITMHTGRVLAGRGVGIVAGALMVVSPRMVHTGRHILLEDLLAPLLAASLFVLSHARQSERWRQTFYAAASGACLALGLLTKQALALCAPAAAAIAELWRRDSGWLWRLAVYAIAGCVPFALWGFVVYQQVGQPFLDAMVGYHIVARFGAPLEGHVRGIGAYASAIDDHLAVFSWPIALVGWVGLWRIVREPRATFLFVMWSVFVTVQYVVVGVVVKTFLPWYQVVVMPLFFIGAAYAIVWTWSRSQWSRVAIIALVTEGVARAMRLDPIPVVLLTLLVVGLLAWRPQVRAKLVPLLPWLTPVALVACALVVANPMGGGDARTAIADRVRHEAATVYGDDWLRVWACYMPQARRESFVDCSQAHPSTRFVVLDNKATACAFDGYSEIFEGAGREDGHSVRVKLLERL